MWDGNEAYNGSSLGLAEMRVRIRRQLGATESLEITLFDEDLFVGRGVVAAVAIVVDDYLFHCGRVLVGYHQVLI